MDVQAQKKNSKPIALLQNIASIKFVDLLQSQKKFNNLKIQISKILIQLNSYTFQSNYLINLKFIEHI